MVKGKQQPWKIDLVMLLVGVGGGEGKGGMNQSVSTSTVEGEGAGGGGEEGAGYLTFAQYFRQLESNGTRRLA